MSEHRQTLNDYLRSKQCKGFRSVPHYQVSSDTLYVYFKDEQACTEDHDGYSLERSMKTGEIVGVKIYGVGRTVDRGREEAREREMLQWKQTLGIVD